MSLIFAAQEITEENIELAAEEAFAKLRWHITLESEDKREKEKDKSKCLDSRECKTIDFTDVRATDLNCNKRVEFVKKLDTDIEVKLENLKMEMTKSFQGWKRKVGKTMNRNLEQDEKRGVNKIIKNINEEKLVVVQTDKSKNLVPETPVNYKESMKPHVKAHKTVTDKELNKIIKTVNGACKSFVQMLGIGKEANQVKRAKNNVHVAYNCEVPVVGGLQKDHKPGKPMRPWVNGNTGPLVNLSDVVSVLLEC